MQFVGQVRANLKLFTRKIVLKPYYILIPLSLLLIGMSIASLRWRMELDPPQNLAYSYWIDHYGYVPYRDFYEQNMPGVYFIYIVVGRLIGYTSDFGFHFFNLIYLGLISSVTWRLVRPAGRVSAWAAIVLFGLFYLSNGFHLIMQKEYFILLPIITAALVSISFTKLNDFLRGFLVGLLFGMVLIVRPHGPIAMPVVLAAMLAEMYHRRDHTPFSLWRAFLVLVVTGAGLVIPPALTALYLYVSGALPYLVDIAVNYWPLYTGFNSELYILHGAERTQYIWQTFPKFYNQPWWLMPAGVGALLAFWPGSLDNMGRRRVLLFLGLALSYAVYTIIPGAFSGYQWMLFFYFLMILCALCFVQLSVNAGFFVRWFPVVLVVLPMFLRVDFLPTVTGDVRAWLRGDPAPPPRVGRVDGIAAYLKEHAHPGDRVQPLDVGDSVMHAMLLADVQPANRFAMDLMFFHDIDNPYIQSLREEFIRDLGATPPRFMVDIYGNPFVHGSNVGQFHDLRLFVASNYEVVEDTVVYQIYDRVTWGDDLQSRAIIAYPWIEEQTASWFADATSIDVIPVDFDPAQDEAQIAQLIAQAASEHDRLTLLFFNEDHDKEQILERYASQNLYRISERWIYGARVVEYLTHPSGCNQLSSQNTRFGENIRLVGAVASLAYPEARQLVCVKLVWMTETPIGVRYKVAAHVFDANGQLVAQYDSVPAGGFASMSEWTPGQEISDAFAVTLPSNLPAGHYELRLVVYDEASQMRLPVIDGTDTSDSLVISGFELGPMP